MDLTNYMFFNKKIRSKIPVSLNFFGKIYKIETKEITKKTASAMIFLDDFDFLPKKNPDLSFFLTFDLFRFGKIELCAKIFNVTPISGDRALIEFDFSGEPWSKRKNLYSFLRKYYFPRYTVNQRATIQKTEPNFSVEAKIINISTNGAFLEVDPALFSSKEIFLLSLDLESEKIYMPVKIGWKNNGKLFDKPNGIGVQFIGKNSDLKKVKRYVHTIEKEHELQR